MCDKPAKTNPRHGGGIAVVRLQRRPYIDNLVLEGRRTVAVAIVLGDASAYHPAVNNTDVSDLKRTSTDNVASNIVMNNADVSDMEQTSTDEAHNAARDVVMNNTDVSGLERANTDNAARNVVKNNSDVSKLNQSQTGIASFIPTSADEAYNVVMNNTDVSNLNKSQTSTESSFPTSADNVGNNVVMNSTDVSYLNQSQTGIASSIPTSADNVVMNSTDVSDLNQSQTGTTSSIPTSAEDSDNAVSDVVVNNTDMSDLNQSQTGTTSSIPTSAEDSNNAVSDVVMNNADAAGNTASNVVVNNTDVSDANHGQTGTASSIPTSSDEANGYVVSAKRRKMVSAYEQRYPLHEAVERGCLEDVRRILESQDVDVNGRDNKGFVPFAIACCNGDVGIMRELLAAGSDPLEWFYFGDQECATTAPLAACYLGNREMLELLFRHGVAVDDTFNEMYELDRVSHGHTLLVTAAGQECEGAKDVVLFLLSRGADVDGKDGHGLSALHAACDSGSVDAARALLSAGASVNICGYKGDAPLHHACNTARIDVMDLLLGFNAEVDQRNVLGETPLMALMSDCEVEQRMAGVHLLVSNGADVRYKTWRGYTALYWAAISPELTRLLLELGARPGDVTEGEPCPLHHACEYGQHRAAELLLDAGAAVNGVNAVGISANELRGTNSTPLIRAIYSRADLDEVMLTLDLLVTRGAALDWKDAEGRTCLYHTVFRMPWDGEPILRYLLKMGAEPNVHHFDGDTLLHTITRGSFRQNGHQSDADNAAAVKALLEFDADSEETDEDGVVPFILATLNQDRDNDNDGPLETMDALLAHKLSCLPCFDDE